MLNAPARHRPGTSTPTLIVALFAALLLTISSGHAAKNTLQRGNGAEPETLDVHKSSGVPAANIQRDCSRGWWRKRRTARMCRGWRRAGP